MCWLLSAGVFLTKWKPTRNVSERGNHAVMPAQKWWVVRSLLIEGGFKVTERLKISEFQPDKKNILEKCHFLVPKIGSTQFLNDLGHFWQFLKFGPFLALFKIFHFLKFFSSFLVWKWAKKYFLEKFLAIFEIFHFFEIFPSFLVWKMGEKNFSREMSFFGAQNWFYPISERFGSFLAIF